MGTIERDPLDSAGYWLAVATEWASHGNRGQTKNALDSARAKLEEAREQHAGAMQALERIATEAEKLWAQGRPTINSAWTASVARDGLAAAGEQHEGLS